MSNKLQAKDLINLGLFTVLYFVIGCCVAIPIGFVPIFLPILGALWSLITGIPFMLFLTRVKKFGMVTIMGILSGINCNAPQKEIFSPLAPILEKYSTNNSKDSLTSIGGEMNCK